MLQAQLNLAFAAPARGTGLLHPTKTTPPFSRCSIRCRHMPLVIPHGQPCWELDHGRGQEVFTPTPPMSARPITTTIRRCSTSGLQSNKRATKTLPRGNGPGELGSTRGGSGGAPWGVAAELLTTGFQLTQQGRRIPARILKELHESDRTQWMLQH